MNGVGYWVKRASQMAGVVLAGFGGFLLNVQPPEGGPKSFTVGFATVLCGLFFLGVSALSRAFAPQSHKFVFTTLSIALAISMIFIGLHYQTLLQQLTIEMPSNSSAKKIVIGTQFTDAAQTFVRKHPEPLTDLLLDFGGADQRESVWTRESISSAKIRLSDWFIALAASLAGCLFCLIELLPST